MEHRQYDLQVKYIFRGGKLGVLPINFDGLAKVVKKGDTIFVAQYMFTGSETTSVWLEVDKVDGNDVDCKIKNSATLAGAWFTGLQRRIVLRIMEEFRRIGIAGPRRVKREASVIFSKSNCCGMKNERRSWKS
ncbi:pyruvate kinase [Artemisia annua]|uniref:Pyruvate kinase n=1 Tax=Artemisia annua TaxID=35608 RepID=A0A2U1NDK7_ARTAN|nr:pyruvate kinase [Artemisia annua]